MTSTNDKTYVVGDVPYLYPGAGDPKPPAGKKVLLLTIGGVCVEGHWPVKDAQRSFLGWAYLPSRDKVKESKLGLR